MVVATVPVEVFTVAGSIATEAGSGGQFTEEDSTEDLVAMEATVVGLADVVLASASIRPGRS